MAPLRWGIASAGRISNDFCAALSALPAENHKIVAVAARNLADAKSFAEKFEIPKFYEGYESLAKDDEIDIVYIGTLNHTHLDIDLMLLDGNKHILCEKPLTLNLKQTTKLLECAKEKNLLCVEAIWSRFFPSYQYLKKRIDDGDLGEIKEVDVSFGFDWTGEGSDRVTKKALGGGTVLDLGVYTIQVSLFALRDEPTSIKATGKLNDDEVDVETEVEIKFAKGGIAKIKTSCLKMLDNKAVIRGTKGSMTLHQVWCPTQVTDIDGTTKVFELPKHRLGDFNYPNSVGLSYEAEEIRKCFNAGLTECDVVTRKESLTISRIQDEIRRQIGVVYDADK
ncbi:unnamed protein product [Chironomus riparius]|uniref:Trans-1,2-dihydrobenzene-1,2-diol dehydrogenase n=1 Tax=Chironomus riparius TaxID=315576 RepID=A0A9P0NP22_9DIPT|nr:unnamed protein product [Chironomus riparius]